MARRATVYQAFGMAVAYRGNRSSRKPSHGSQECCCAFKLQAMECMSCTALVWSSAFCAEGLVTRAVLFA